VKEPDLDDLAGAVAHAMGEAFADAEVFAGGDEAPEPHGAPPGAEAADEQVRAASDLADAGADAGPDAGADAAAPASPDTPAAPAAPGRPIDVRYAEALLRQVKLALRTVPEDELGPAFAALAAFIAEPRPDTFLAASHALHDARYGRAARRLMAAHDGRLFRRGLEALRAVPGVDPAHAEVLARLPMDGRTGQRLMAVAQLLEVHIELAGRAAAASREIRRKLGTPAKPVAPAGWRAGPGRRA
jgi:hypothetical protein